MSLSKSVNYLLSIKVMRHRRRRKLKPKDKMIIREFSDRWPFMRIAQFYGKHTLLDIRPTTCALWRRPRKKFHRTNRLKP